MVEDEKNIDIGDEELKNDTTPLDNSSDKKSKQMDFVPKKKLSNLEKKPFVIKITENKQMDIAKTKSSKKITEKSKQIEIEPEKSLVIPENSIGHIALLPAIIPDTKVEPKNEAIEVPLIPVAHTPNKKENHIRKEKKKKSSKKKIPLLLYGLAAIILLFGIGMSINQYLTNRRNDKQAQHYVDLANSGRPSPAPATIKPSTDDIGKYQVAPNMPRYMIIPSLKVFARVRSVGVDKTGAIGTPTNVFDTAWYNQSSLPGQPGASLIDGHVSSWKTNGVFYGLKNIKPGELVKVQRGDGKVFTFSVVKSQVYPYDSVDMTEVLAPIVAGVPGLNLITCTGKVIHGTNEFNQRMVVFTKLVSQT